MDDSGTTRGPTDMKYDAQSRGGDQKLWNVRADVTRTHSLLLLLNKVTQNMGHLPETGIREELGLND